VDSLAADGTMAGMEDIARRLRSWVKDELQESDPAAVLLQAADEIERLRNQGDGLADRVGSLFRETQELYRHIATQQPWIPVEEQWPTHGSDVLVAYKAGEYVLLGVGEFDGTTVNDDGVTVPYFKGIGGFEVTHWMPLPEPPTN
jgi:hypothetical protein